MMHWELVEVAVYSAVAAAEAEEAYFAVLQKASSVSKMNWTAAGHEIQSRHRR